MMDIEQLPIVKEHVLFYCEQMTKSAKDDPFIIPPNVADIVMYLVDMIWGTTHEGPVTDTADTYLDYMYIRFCNDRRYVQMNLQLQQIYYTKFSGLPNSAGVAFVMFLMDEINFKGEQDGNLTN